MIPRHRYSTTAMSAAQAAELRTAYRVLQVLPLNDPLRAVQRASFVRMLRTYWNQRISLRTMARCCGVSPQALHQMIKREDRLKEGTT